MNAMMVTMRSLLCLALLGALALPARGDEPLAPVEDTPGEPPPAGEEIPPEPPPAALVVPVAPPATVERAPLRWPAFVLVGLGGAGLATGAALSAVARTSTADNPTDRARNQAMQAAGTYLLAGGGALAAGGVIAAVLQSRKRGASTESRLSVAPAGLGLQIAGSF